MRIFLTGAHGMVGRNLLRHPGFAKHEILSPSHAELDLTSAAQVTSFLQEHKPDFIVNAAGRVGGIQANIKNPVAFLVDNIDINRNVILGAYKAGIKHLLNLGSSCMYPREAPNPLRESLILHGELEPTNEGYALAKIMAQRLCQYVMKEAPGFMYKTLIPCNLYGPYDKFNLENSHLIPAAILKIHNAKYTSSPVEVWGDGEARREFMYVEDLNDCIVRGIENFESLPNLMNVGIGSDYSINEYYKAVAEVVGYSGPFKHDLTKPVGMRKKLVSTKLATEWGWTSKYTLTTGLKRTYDYYLQLEKAK